MKVLGIDQSYTRTGFAIAESGKVIRCGSYNFKGLKTKTEKRNKIRQIVENAILKYNPELIIVERVRLRSQGFLNFGYIMSTAALISVIVDVAYAYSVKVYSVDTRAWKSKILGSSKAKPGQTQKEATMQHFIKLGLDIKDDDMADACGIALYPFIPKKLQRLKEEK